MRFPSGTFVKQWQTKAGFEAVIWKHPHGHLCGYVGVPQGHPLHGADCWSLAGLEVHGGVSFAGVRGDDKWWIGFDCAHIGDKREVCNEYVAAECERLAKQLNREERS